MEDTPDRLEGLRRLEAEIARDLARLNHPPADWVPPRTDADGRRIADVAIVGGGMCGLAAAFALRRLGIPNIRHVDRRPEGLEGPWRTYARMRTLRSPKHLTGPVMGLAGLTFRAWYEAQGLDWEALDRIPTDVWMEYLVWYRRVTGAPIENGVGVTALIPAADGAALELSTGERFSARHVVLATGREGQAAPRIPAPFQPFFGAEVRHTSDEIDFTALAGRQVVVVGLAASAFDNAAAALEAGARVTMIGRAPALPRLNKMKQTVYPGFTHGFADLPDAAKLAFLDHVVQQRVAPPRSSVQRIATDPNLTLMLGAEITEVARTDTGISLRTGHGTIRADLVILGTGFAIDLDAPPETAAFASSILRWGDRVSEATGEWADFPYLGPGFEYLGRTDLPGLGRIRCFTHASQLSLGNLANDIPAISEGADRLARAIASALFIEDRAHHLERLHAYAEPELLGDEWPGLTDWAPPV